MHPIFGGASTEIDKVGRVLAGRRSNAPSGFEVTLDGHSHHLDKPAMIGRIAKDGRCRLPTAWCRRSRSAPGLRARKSIRNKAS
jgi:hypothetical protein